MLLGSFRSPDLAPHGRVIERTAVRGVLFRGPELLLLASRHGDYKFPGGGVEPGESHPAAVRREFREECGLVDVSVGPGLGSTIEEVPAIEPAYDIFRMTSHYFRCSGGASGGVRELEAYEAELELVPRWVTVDEALAANRAVQGGGVGVMRWLVRETAVLEWLAAQDT
ncbi:8-oxo-dGTP pyrophosphatase MutT (NUDIX family) [Kribbella antiqua]|uniref:8-oxo-dGTP pyrophosphatase MutT (NUDIX family) n=1 Tax=Kribbella antiqua TaxID=2512217 RepID=A0A4R2JAP1_9ACTN|nr:NUDIX domain-containing protein [Kribbella antiqua]TCO51765.1 8-oxo-dGTP pyrophosphatase MutT (NUDIX family) [Kribbella antiqua]